MLNMNDNNAQVENNNAYLREFLKLRQEILEGEKTWANVLELREKYNQPILSKETLRKGALIFDEYNNMGWLSEPQNNDNKSLNFSKTETVELRSDGNIGSDKLIGMLPDEIKNPDILLKAHGFNPNEFELVSAKNSKWQQGSKVGAKDLYSSKIVVKPIDRLISDKEIEEHFKNFIPKKYKIYKDKDYNCFGKSLLVIPLMDVHFGRFGSELELGTDYNLDIAKNDIINGLQNYLSKINIKDFGKVLLIIGQDFFNSSSTGYTSSQRHKQDNCCNFRDMFIKGSELLIEIINMFNAYTSVKVMCIEGNHAREEEIMLFQLLKAWYRNDEDVNIDATPSPRKYFLWGKNLIGSTHGSDEKERIFGLMPQECPTLWGDTDYHCYIVGHLHHYKVEEKNGVDVFVVPALCKNDSWTNKVGYKAKRRTIAFIFDYNEGLIQQNYINLE